MDDDFDGSDQLQRAQVIMRGMNAVLSHNGQQPETELQCCASKPIGEGQYTVPAEGAHGLCREDDQKLW